MVRCEAPGQASVVRNGPRQRQQQPTPVLWSADAELRRAESVEETKCARKGVRRQERQGIETSWSMTEVISGVLLAVTLIRSPGTRQ